MIAFEPVYIERVKKRKEANLVACESADMINSLTEGFEHEQFVSFWREFRNRFRFQMSQVSCFRCGCWPCACSDGITLINGDARNVMDMFSEPFDITITDPPYGMQYSDSRRAKPRGLIHGDDAFPSDIIPMLSKITANSLFVFCRWDNLYDKDIPKPKSFIAWLKGCHTLGDLSRSFGRAWEGIAFWPQSGHEFVTRPRDYIFQEKVWPKDSFHPAEKPVKLIETLLDSVKGMTVFDPFAGSGSTLIAAKNKGLKAIGVEIDERYCQVVADRLNNVKRTAGAYQPPLFMAQPHC